MRILVALVTPFSIAQCAFTRETEDALRTMGVEVVEMPSDQIHHHPELAAIVHDESSRVPADNAIPVLRSMSIEGQFGMGTKYQINSDNFHPAISTWVADDNELRSTTVLFLWLIAFRALDDGTATVTPEERRVLEVILGAVRDAIDGADVEGETRNVLIASSHTIGSQLRSPRPDRSIVRRALRTIVAFGGGLVTGVVGNQLFALLESF